MHSLLNALLGGVLLGTAASIYLLIHGRIAGISGLLAQLLESNTWRRPANSHALWFMGGLLVTALAYGYRMAPPIEIAASPAVLIIAGLLVGFGTRLGSGCTSGHGICGISRLSMRSLVATLTFMSMGFIVVYCMRHVIGLA